MGVIESSDLIGGFAPNKLVQDLPFEVYQNVEALNASKLKTLHAKSEAHLKTEMEEGYGEPTEAMLFGSAFHAALLEPERFREFLRVEPKFDKRTNAGKAGYADFLDSIKEGDIIVKEEWLVQIAGMLESLSKHPFVAPLLQKGSREVCLFWRCPVTGREMKVRFDFITEDGIPLDIKTIEDAHPDNCNAEIFKKTRNYWIQAGHYGIGAEVTEVCTCEVFLFVFIEKKPPYAITIKTLEGPIFEVAKHYVKTELYYRWDKALKTGEWPAYSQSASMVDIGQWFLDKYGSTM